MSSLLPIAESFTRWHRKRSGEWKKPRTRRHREGCELPRSGLTGAVREVEQGRAGRGPPLRRHMARGGGRRLPEGPRQGRGSRPPGVAQAAILCRPRRRGGRDSRRPCLATVRGVRGDRGGTGRLCWTTAIRSRPPAHVPSHRYASELRVVPELGGGACTCPYPG